MQNKAQNQNFKINVIIKLIHRFVSNNGREEVKVSDNLKDNLKISGFEWLNLSPLNNHALIMNMV